MPPRKKTEATPDVVDGVDLTDPSLALPDAPPEQPIDLIAAWNEPTPDELEAAAKYGVSVETLREIRAQAAADIGAAVVARQDAGLDTQADYCAVCLPNGWPAGGNHLDCPHGTWTR